MSEEPFNMSILVHNVTYDSDDGNYDDRAEQVRSLKETANNLLRALTATQARVIELERWQETVRDSSALLQQHKTECSAIARAALELAKQVAFDCERDGVAQGIANITIDAIMARAKETGNVG